MSHAPLFSRVLLVEDDQSHALLIGRALKGTCAEQCHVTSLGQAKEAAVAQNFDLIVTDLNLPDATNARSVYELRQLFPFIPLVALTSSSLLQDAVEAMKFGASDFLVKEFGPNFGDVLKLALGRVHSAALLVEQNRKIQTEMAALRGAIENGGDGMAVVGMDGEVEYANRALHAFVRLWEGKPEKVSTLFGSGVQDFTRANDSLSEKCRTLGSGAVWNSEVTLVSDKLKAFEVSVSVLADGNSTTRVLWVRDISDLKRREKFQRDMLATTTHDLKNPLGAISISAELLTQLIKENGKARELVLRVGSSAQSALNMIDEFLSARRIKEGSFILKPSIVNVAELVKFEVENFKMLFATRQIDFQSSGIDNSVEWNVDKVGLQRTLNNLLSNAIKFTPKGGVVRLVLDVRGDELHLIVSDSGCGMEPSEVNKIFERYSRLEKHSDIPGAGLGLFVVKSIVAAHAGRVEVQSQLSKGTTFEVIFPRNPPVNERGEVISLDFTA